MTEEHGPRMTLIAEGLPEPGADRQAAYRSIDLIVQHKDAGPDRVAITVTDPEVAEYLESMKADATLPAYSINKWLYRDDGPEIHYRPHMTILLWVTFAPDEGQAVRFSLADDAGIFTLNLDYLTLEEWTELSQFLTRDNADRGIVVTGLPNREDFFKTPGRLVDTPRHAAKHNDLPAISQWYTQTTLSRVVAMAAAALTNVDTRQAALGWQSATVNEFVDLVFWREDGTLAHGQNRKDILEALEALRAVPVPIVGIHWRRVGNRWKKEYGLRVDSMFQGYGAVFEDKTTGKTVFASDPAYKRDLVPKKQPRKKAMRDLIRKNMSDSIMQSFPPDRYELTRVEWRWNTDIAEDFICPQVGIDEKDRPRRKLRGGFHIEGSRFINLNRRYFEVQKHLRKANRVYAARLLDFIVSEKTHIQRRRKGAVTVEIQADTIVKWLGLWPEYEGHPKHVLEGHIAPAIKALMEEDVLLSGSWELPKQDPNPDRRKSKFYRWKVAELWSTVALVTPEQGKVVESILSQASVDAMEQATLPGMDPPDVPSGADIRAAREAAGVTLRDFARRIKGPDFSTWSRYESGKPVQVDRIPEDVWSRVRVFIDEHLTKDGQGT